MVGQLTMELEVTKSLVAYERESPRAEKVYHIEMPDEPTLRMDSGGWRALRAWGSLRIARMTARFSAPVAGKKTFSAALMTGSVRVTRGWGGEPRAQGSPAPGALAPRARDVLGRARPRGRLPRAQQDDVQGAECLERSLVSLCCPLRP